MRWLDLAGGAPFMSTTLVLPGSLVRELERHTRLRDESGAVLLVRRHATKSGTIRLLGRSLHWVPGRAYLLRSPREMRIGSEGYMPALGLAEETRSIPMWLHTHPVGSPLPSGRDARVEAALADVFRLRSGSPFFGTVICSPAHDGLALTGTLQKAGAARRRIDRFWVVGDRWRLYHAFDVGRRHFDPGVFDRSVRAFGEAVQRTIGDLDIAVVGVGGTGSCVAEQLVRLGARKLLLVDADVLSSSNVTRVYGSTSSKVGERKTEVLAEHLRAIAPDLRYRLVHGFCSSASVARSLAGADLLFGCTDDNAGRLVLSRLSSYYLVPVIDIGILLSSDATDTLTGIDGRVTVLSPGTACLLCRGRVDLARAAAEMQTPEERTRLADEGYSPALAEVEPAVVAFTTMVASFAVSELLERLIGYGDSPRPSEVLLRIHDRAISTNEAYPCPGHYCDPATGKLGWGDAEPFLEQVWAEEERG